MGVRRFGATISIPMLLCAALSAQPREILIIRHAEKSGSSFDPNLTQRGYQRAAALLNLFSASFDRPDYLFASKRSKRSNRCVETMTPLATALRMTLNSNIPDEGYAYLARDLLTNRQYAGKVLIVCWHHGKIPAFAKALGIANPPKPWPDAAFDRVWRIRFAATGPTLENLPQHLLPGDSTQ